MTVGRRAKPVWWHENINEKLKFLLLPILLLELITFGPFKCFCVILSFKQGLVYSHFAHGIVNGHSEVSEMVEKWGAEDALQICPPQFRLWVLEYITLQGCCCSVIR